jgi:LmbE family N-acetylglucosaminyl deacetylase
MAAVDAAYPAARNPMAFPWLARDGLAAHRVRRLYLFWSNSPTVRIDVSATIGRKVDALRAHASQLKDPAGIEDRIRQWAAEEGQAIGVAAAEALRVIVIDDDADEGPAGAEAEAAEATARVTVGPAAATQPAPEPAPEPAR